MKEVTVDVAIDVGIRQETFGRATLDGDTENFGSLEIFAGLGRKKNARVLLAPGFQRFGHVVADYGVPQKAPGFVDDEDLQGSRPAKAGHYFWSGIVDCGVGAVEEIEQQGFEELGIGVQALEVDVLEARQREGVFDVVEDTRIGAALHPLLQLLCKGAAE